MSAVANEFDEKAAPPAMTDAETYRALLEKLVAQGQGLGKTESVGGFLLRDMKIQTETSAGEVETTKDIKIDLFLLMDITQYPLHQQRQLIVEDLAAKWGKKTLGKRDLNSADLKKKGIWINKPGAVNFDYIVPANPEENSELLPNPNATRVCLTIDKPVNIPVQWEGGFFIANGGTLAIRERDFKALTEALQSIKEGKATAEEALFSAPGVAKFDVYGMEPGFAEKQYGAVPLKAETSNIQAAQTDKAVKLVTTTHRIKG